MSVLSAGISALRPSRVGAPPFGIVADIANRGFMDRHRGDANSHDFVIHVSDLIRPDKARAFCAREWALRHFESRETPGKIITPGFALLFAVGNAVHDSVRNAFIQRSEFADAAWGTWSCRCGFTKRTGPFTKGLACKRCGTPALVYEEYDLYSKTHRLVGHPDLLLLWGDTYYIYEIKTIDKKDVDFETLTHPMGDHVLQASFYNWMLREEGKKVDPTLRFIYADRSTKKLFNGTIYKELTAPTAPISRLQPFLDKATSLDRAIVSRVLPDRICDSPMTSRARNCTSCTGCFMRQSNKA